MARPIRTIDIYLPLDYNDGQPIPETRFVSLHRELLNRYGGVTSLQRQFPLKTGISCLTHRETRTQITR